MLQAAIRRSGPPTFPDAPEKLFLFAGVDRGTPLLIEDDPRVHDLLTYDLVSVDDTGMIALRHPSTRMFLSCEPPAIGGALLATRSLVKEWEKFMLVGNDPANIDLFEDPRMQLIGRFARSDRDLRRFFFDHHDAELGILCSIFPALLSIAGLDQAESLRTLCGAGHALCFVILDPGSTQPAAPIGGCTLLSGK